MLLQDDVDVVLEVGHVLGLRADEVRTDDLVADVLGSLLGRPDGLVRIGDGFIGGRRVLGESLGGEILDDGNDGVDKPGVLVGAATGEEGVCVDRHVGCI